MHRIGLDLDGETLYWNGFAFCENETSAKVFSGDATGIIKEMRADKIFAFEIKGDGRCRVERSINGKQYFITDCGWTETHKLAKTFTQGLAEQIVAELWEKDIHANVA